MDHQQHIDSLLHRYLLLLDEYTTLRSRLSDLQTGVYQGIARANFSAERGLRYGRDQYDDRMQASRRVAIKDEKKEDGVTTPIFSVVDGSAEKATAAAGHKEGEDTGESAKEDESDDNNKEASATGEGEEEKKQAEEPPAAASATKQHVNNPLRWFGILAPMPLRNAQSLSVEAVEQVIPRLVTVNAEMLDLEIEVRRARKKRAKAGEQGKGKGTSAEDTTSTPGLSQPVEA